MKQKIVIKVRVHCERCRKQAMKIAATSDGVISVTLQGNDQDQIVVIGNDVDSADLCTALRKKLKGATLISVEEVKPPKPEEKKPEEKKPEECKTEGKKAEEKKPEKCKKQEPAAKIVNVPGMYYHPCQPQPPPYCYPNPPQYYVCAPVPPDDYNQGCSVM